MILDRILQLALNATAPLIGLLALPFLMGFYASETYAHFSQVAIVVGLVSLVLTARLELMLPTGFANGEVNRLAANMRQMLAASLPLAVAVAALTPAWVARAVPLRPLELAACGLLVLAGCVVAWLTNVLMVYAACKGATRRLGAARLVQSVALFGSQLILWHFIDPLLALLLGLCLGYAGAVATLAPALDASDRAALFTRNRQPLFTAAEVAAYAARQVPMSLVSQFNTMGGALIFFAYAYGAGVGGLAFLSFRVVASAAVAVSLVVESWIFDRLSRAGENSGWVRTAVRSALGVVAAGALAILAWYGFGRDLVDPFIAAGWKGIADFVPPSMVAWTAQLIFAPTVILWTNAGESGKALAAEVVRACLTLAAIGAGWQAGLTAIATFWLAMAVFAAVSLTAAATKLRSLAATPPGRSPGA